MSFIDFLNSKAVTLCFLGIGALLIAAYMAALEVSANMVLIAELLFIIIVALWLGFGYFFESKRMKKLNRLVDGLEEKYLIGEVLPEPRGLVEREYYDIMKTISRSAIGLAEQAVRDKEEYCDYVESWIHEIKTPLTACSLILSNGADERKLRRELKNADNLTQSILYYARMRSSQNDLRIREVHVKKAMDEAVSSQMEILIASKIGVDVEGDFIAYTDDKSLCFILKQLLINCAKYCAGCHINMKADKGIISVEDNGIGIPSHEIKMVTRRGFTGTNGRKLGSSTGMGLYIVNELCKNMDMDLKIESERGSYTRVSLVFKSLTKA